MCARSTSVSDLTVLSFFLFKLQERQEKTNKKQGQKFIVSKAPLCKGSCRANARLRDCEMLRREQKEEREVSDNPSVIFLRKCHLLVRKGGLGLVPLKRVYVIIAWLAG